MTALKRSLWRTLALALTVPHLASAPAQAKPWVFSYGGQLLEGGKPVEGTIAIELKFYKQAAGGTALAVSPVVFNNVTLQDGAFQVDASQLTDAELDLIFKGDTATFVEVLVNGKPYYRQKIVAVPYALRVPVDGKRAKFDDTTGKLTVGPAGNAAAGEFLTVDGNGNWTWQTPVAGAAGSIGTKTIDNAVVPTTGQILRYDGGSDSWKPAPVIATSAGDNGKVLKSNGSGVFWDTPGGGGNMSTSTYDSSPADSVVDNAAKLNGQAASFYLDASNIASGVLGEPFIPSSIARDAELPTSLPPSGTAGGALAGSYPSPTLANSSVTLASLSTTGTNCNVNGSILKSTGTAWTCDTDLNSGGTVTSITPGVGFTSGSAITGSGVLDIDVGTTALKIVQLDVSAKLPPVDGSLLTNINASAVATGTLGVANGGTGETTIGGLRDAVLSSQTGNANKVLTTNGTNPLWVNATLPGSTVQAQDGGAGAPGLSFLSESDVGLFRPSADTLGFATAGAARVTIDSNGKVGIGTTSPTTLLHVASSGTASTRIQAGTGSSAELSLENDSGRWDFIHDALDSNKFKLARTGAPRITVASGGDVGIGTTSPSSTLHLNESSGDVAMTLQASARTWSTLVDNGNGSFIFHDVTGATDRLVLKSNGSVGIGNSNPVSKLNVTGGSITLENNAPTAGDGRVVSKVQSSTVQPEFRGHRLGSAGAGVPAGQALVSLVGEGRQQDGSELVGGAVKIVAADNWGAAGSARGAKVLISANKIGTSTAAEGLAIYGTHITLGGGMIVKVRADNGATVPIADDDYVVVLTNATSASVNLPTCNSGTGTGRVLMIRNNTPASVTLNAGAATVSGGTLSANYSRTLVCEASGTGSWYEL